MTFKEMVQDLEDPNKYDESFEKYDNILKTTDDFLTFIKRCTQELDESDLQLTALVRTASRVLNRMRPDWDEYDPDLDKRLVAYQKYIFSWDWIVAKVPGQETQEIKEQGLALLKTWVENDQLENIEKTKEFMDFKDLCGDTIEKLRSSGNYPQLDELMDG